jgi:hypothetical protein
LYHWKSCILSHGGEREEKNHAKSYSQESAQSILEKDREKSRVQNTNSKSLNVGYLGYLHNLRPGKGLARNKRMINNLLRGI